VSELEIIYIPDTLAIRVLFFLGVSSSLVPESSNSPENWGSLLYFFIVILIIINGLIPFPF